MTWFAQLSDDGFEALLAELTKLDKGLWLGPSELESRVLRAAPSLGDEGAQRLVEAVLSIAAAISVHGDKLDDFVAGISRSTDLELDEGQRPKLAHRLTIMLSAPPIAATAKAADVLTEQDRIFHSCRIMTDIRPVFGDDPSAPPNGGVVFHTLKVDMFRVGGMEEIYVAMTNEDLLALKRTVDRAIAKNSSLGTYLDSVGFSRFEEATDD